VTGADPGMEEKARALLLARPAVAATSAARHGRIIVLDNYKFLPLSPYTTKLIDALADALWPYRDQDGFVRFLPPDPRWTAGWPRHSWPRSVRRRSPCGSGRLGISRATARGDVTRGMA